MKKNILCILLLLAMSSVAFGTDVNVKNYGAKGDGVTVDSDSINDAITVCNQSGGGTVTFPAGTYLCRSIRMKSNVALFLDGATIKGASGIDAAEPNQYDMYQDYGHSHFRDALIWGENLNNIKITGNGTIDGNGALVTGNPSTNQGDKVFSFKLCTNIEIGGIDNTHRMTMTHYGHFAFLLTGCDTLNIHNLYAPNAGTQRDFIDLMQSSNVSVNDITVDNTSDDIVKLGSDYSLGFAKPSKNIHTTNVTAYSNCNVCMIGSETVAPISNVSFKNITVLGTGKSGIGIMSNDGSIVDSITVDNVTMTGTKSTIWIKITNRERCPDSVKALGKIKNVSISNVTVANCQSGEYGSTISGFIGSNSYSTVENVRLHNIKITSYGGHPASDASIVPPELDFTKSGADYNPSAFGIRPSYGFYLRHANNITFDSVQMDYGVTDGRPVIMAQDANNIIFKSVTAERGTGRIDDIVFKDSCGYTLSNSPGIVVTNGPSALTALPAPPSNLVVSVASKSQIDLSWNDNSDNENTFRIERAINDTVAWTLLKTVSANVTQYSDTGLTLGTAYYYRVRAENSNGNSNFSNIANATPSNIVRENIWIEAESGTITSPFVVRTDPLASGGAYIVNQTKDNTTPTASNADYNFTVTTGGTYFLWGRTLWSTTSYNSIFVQMDANGWFNWGDNNACSSTWRWNKAINADNGNAIVTFNLGAGAHTFHLARREDGAQLDALLFTNDTSFIPTTMLPTGIFGTAGQNLVPKEFTLQCYPNPFNPTTVMSYQLPVASRIDLKIYDLLGREVVTLINESKPAGTYSIQWNASGSPSGIYLARMNASQTNGVNYIKTIKLLLMK